MEDYNKMKVKLSLFGIGLVLLLSILIVSCSTKTTEDTSSAEQEAPAVSITVISVEDLSQRIDYLGRPLRNNNLRFEILLEPSSVDAIIPWEKYIVALVSKDGYIFSSQEVVPWIESDFREPPAAVRDINEINKILKQRERTVFLEAPSSDKDIQPLYRELTEDYWNINLTETVQKHITITFMTMEEWAEWIK